MDKFLKDLLIKSYGLDPNATEEQAIAHLRAMTEGQRAELSAVIGTEGESKIAALMKKPETAVVAPPVVAARQPGSGSGDTDGEFVALEAKRVTNIKSLVTGLKTGEASVDRALEVACLSEIAAGSTLTQARQNLLAALQKALAPIKGAVESASISIGEDQNVASLRSAIPQAIMLRANPDLEIDKIEAFEKREARDKTRRNTVYLGKIHERTFQLRQQSILGMFRTYLRALGAGDEVMEMSPVALANSLGPRSMRQAFPKLAMLAESTSDFANITLDAIHKTMRFMYLDAPKTWNIWAQRQTNPDFKNINRVVLSEAPDMVAAKEGAEIRYVNLSDSKEVYALAEYKAGIKLTRRAIINDDMDAFNQLPRAQANSAARKEDDVAYAVLTGNANMADSNALFSSAHSNLAGSGTAISIPSLQVAATAIKKQKGLGAAARLELVPKFLLVPTSIEESTAQMIGSDILIAGQVGDTTAGQTAKQVGNKNPFFNRYKVIGSTRLDDNNATRWYLSADYRDGQINTIEVCFLTDEPEPVVRQETDFDTEDVKYLVRHTVAAKAIDYRGLYANPGA
jgi:hypothetical protein